MREREGGKREKAVRIMWLKSVAGLIDGETYLFLFVLFVAVFFSSAKVRLWRATNHSTPCRHVRSEAVVRPRPVVKLREDSPAQARMGAPDSGGADWPANRISYSGHMPAALNRVRFGGGGGVQKRSRAGW